MKRKKIIFSFILYFTIFSSLNAFANSSYVYNKSIDGISSLLMLNIEETNNGFIYEIKEDGLKYICNSDLSTNTFIYTRPDIKTKLNFNRVEDRIVIKGMIEGQKIDKTIEIDSIPWYQDFTYCLSSFIMSNNKRLVFWIIDPDTLKVTKFAATKKEKEVVELGGKEIEAYRVKVSLNGFYSIFWSVDSWYRASDGTFIKYKGTDGPASPEVIIKLQSPIYE